MIKQKVEKGSKYHVLPVLSFNNHHSLILLLNTIVKRHILCFLITASEFGHETGLLLLQNTGTQQPSSTSQHQVFIPSQRSKICQSIISSDVLLLSTDRNKSLAVH